MSLRETTAAPSKSCQERCKLVQVLSGLKSRIVPTGAFVDFCLYTCPGLGIRLLDEDMWSVVILIAGGGVIWDAIATLNCFVSYRLTNL